MYSTPVLTKLVSPRGKNVHENFIHHEEFYKEKSQKEWWHYEASKFHQDVEKPLPLNTDVYDSHEKLQYNFRMLNIFYDKSPSVRAISSPQFVVIIFRIQIFRCAKVIKKIR